MKYIWCGNNDKYIVVVALLLSSSLFFMLFFNVIDTLGIGRVMWSLGRDRGHGSAGSMYISLQLLYSAP